MPHSADHSSSLGAGAAALLVALVVQRTLSPTHNSVRISVPGRGTLRSGDLHGHTLDSHKRPLQCSVRFAPITVEWASGQLSSQFLSAEGGTGDVSRRTPMVTLFLWSSGANKLSCSGGRPGRGAPVPQCLVSLHLAFLGSSSAVRPSGETLWHLLVVWPGTAPICSRGQ